MKILMCKPQFYGIEYEINPWMKMSIKVDSDLAFIQWQQLVDLLKKCGATIEFVEPVSGLPDMVFTANAGLIISPKQVLISHFKYPQRVPEENYFKDWFMNVGFEIINSLFDNQYTFEGEGDALFQGDDKLWVGYGFRSDQKYYTNIESRFPLTLINCELIDPYFYHLDTCFCPVTKELALWWPLAFSEESQKRMRLQKIKLLAVNEKEAKKFACNSIVIGKHIIMPAGCNDMGVQLTQLGFNVHFCDMSEFIKAGGACKCLILKLERF